MLGRGADANTDAIAPAPAAPAPAGLAWERRPTGAGRAQTRLTTPNTASTSPPGPARLRRGPQLPSTLPASLRNAPPRPSSRSLIRIAAAAAQGPSAGAPPRAPPPPAPPAAPAPAGLAWEPRPTGVGRAQTRPTTPITASTSPPGPARLYRGPQLRSTRT